MRSVVTALATALENAPEKGLVVRGLVSLNARNLATGVVRRFNFSTEVDTYDFQVRAGGTGTITTRSYVGGGTILDIAPVRLGLGLGVKQWTCTLSMLHPEVASLVNQHSARGQAVEMHLAVIDPATRAVVTASYCDFEGIVSDGDLTGAATGGEGGFTLVCSGHTLELTRANYALRGDAEQRKRSGDRFYRYVDIMGQVDLPWALKTDKPLDKLFGGNNKPGKKPISGLFGR